MKRISFRLAYWAAHLGLMASYIPLFGLYFPVRVAQLSDTPLNDQSGIVLIGSLTASLAGVFAGRASDWVFARTGSRHPMLLGGLALIGCSYGQFALAATLVQLLLAVVVLQIGINVVLGGLNALFAQHVAAAQKAQLSSMVILGLPIANVGMILFGTGDDGAMQSALAWILLLIVVLFLPILGWKGVQGEPKALADAAAAHPIYAARPTKHQWLTIFGARFLVQLSSAFLLTFVEPYLRDSFGTNMGRGPDLGTMAVVAAMISVPVALIAARLAARRVNPISVLLCAAVVLAMAMASLAAAPTAGAGVVASYAAFMAALVTYLALDTALVAQWLAHSPAVGARLGVMNLANTLPGIIIPMALLIGAGSAGEGLRQTLWFTAIAAAAAALLLAHIRRHIGPA